MLHTYWVGDAMGIFKKHYRMNAKIALNIRIPPFWTDSDMIRDYHTYVFAAKKHLFEKWGKVQMVNIVNSTTPKI